MIDNVPKCAEEKSASAQHPATALDPEPLTDSKAKMEAEDATGGVNAPSPVARSHGDSPSADAASKKRKKVRSPPPMRQHAGGDSTRRHPAPHPAGPRPHPPFHDAKHENGGGGGGISVGGGVARTCATASAVEGPG